MEIILVILTAFQVIGGTILMYSVDANDILGNMLVYSLLLSAKADFIIYLLWSRR
jgi:hypothetical protein